MDEVMEPKNFKYAGETLGEIWSQVVIDTFPTKAEYKSPETSDIDTTFCF